MSVKDALGNTTSYNYNSTGKLLSYTTPRGNTYSYTYDGNGNMLTETDPMDGVVGYEYNAFDTAASFTDANGNKTQYTYDLLNRLTSETSATGDSDNYTYDAVSNLTAYTNKRGQNIGYTYDKDGRMTNRTTVEGATAYTYDNNGNLLTVTDNNGTISRTYDNLNRVTSYTNANGDTIGYEYDNVGNITKLTYPDSKEVTYTYNADNQMTSVTDWNGHKTTYAYDENGRLSKINRPDGSTETYTYNVIGQLLTAVDKSANGTVINEYSYAYDADGNIITENSLNEPVASDFGIDSAEMGYGLANQLNSFNGVPISYDKDGNMLSTPLSDKWGTLTYDSLNNLTDITTSAGAIAYDYDAEGYRTSKTEYGITTDFVVNPNAELSQVLMSTTGGETTYYVYGLGLVSQENSEGYKLYHYDYRGSTTAITNINGTVTDIIYYDPYGNVVKRSGTNETPFLYVGQYGVETDINGLYYMRARYYNPTIQRFINVDPIRDGYNWYGYVGGNPVLFLDYTGLDLVLENYILRYADGVNNVRYVSQKEIDQIVSDLNSITDYNIRFDNGFFVSDYILKNSEEIEHPIGNILIRRILEDDIAFKIYVNADTNETKFTYDPTIYRISYNFNEDLDKGIFIEKNGKIVDNVKGSNPSYMALAHELTHAYRQIIGVNIVGRIDIKNTNTNEMIMLEEYQTVGLGAWYNTIVVNHHFFNGKFIITENDLRAENGLPRREQY